ncbi:MAG: hypothetical protein HYR64_05965 [Fimbriimonas ginsengisoli]|uniref:Uncharacterized protein n=1 Tax=Fimbriimonas ginsengisoli TaxID=1005039 RepID=A0A931LVJ2_FIMGI|nr:hypothetical protein [Fimbriimonas ginsengisoli]
MHTQVHTQGQPEALDRLAAELPRFADVARLDDIANQARATLSWAVAGALKFPADVQPVPTDPTTCPNCGLPAISLSSPYCSDCCRDEAAFVRQVRTGLAEGSIFDPERQVALGQKLWRLVGGGYPLRRAMVPEKTKLKVLERADWRCKVCGAPATTVDHIGSG